LDRILVEEADLVFANSPPTYKNKRRINHNTHRLPSGVDVDLFEQAISPKLKEHPAIASMPRPRIGYIGTINERLDYNCLEYLAESRPHWHLVFAGDTYPWRKDAPILRRLAAYPNVHIIGQLPYQQLPSLLKGMDVCLIPYISDERGLYRSPLKLYEYLAAGRPVVSTENPEVIEFAPIVRIAKNPISFVEQIASALAEDNPLEQSKRIQIARRNSWDLRVDQMERLIWQTLEDKS
jgi:glycosyltransferase involved in cell wall biosynthesis